ncbi:hypothetical protein Pmani_036646 [Petrolisthes manimaculis]|uniref:Endonuclease/exonuclease/phosphatase domain-containing protein n=1 Tax=Petrolisthes manimaculis TaxID=1843537 RepID=A0AAE1NIZ5_9EUCA|nr:hypothetical protein Pmani_036646 [Petrolisthes manimaculis]
MEGGKVRREGKADGGRKGKEEKEGRWTEESYRDSGTQAKEGESRTNNCHFPNTGENYNIGGGGNSGNNNYNNYRIRNRQQQSRQRATRTRQQQEGYYHPPTAQYRSSLSSHHPAGQNSSIHIRPAKQHRPPAPPRGRGEETVCSYCSRRGHTIKDCKTRAAEQRQEHLLRRVIAEVRQPTPSFPSPPPGFSNIVPQPPLWGQTPGWQWAPNLPYLNNHANQQQLRHRTDIAVVTETWLTSEVESTFGKIPGYTHWIREDRHRRQGGGVAICLKEGLQAHRLDIETPPLTEAVFLRVVMANGTGLLLCAMYRSPRQGPDPINFLTEHLDDLLTRHRCRHVLIVGDLNHHMEGAAYENLLTVQGLTDYVTFPTHERGGTLDPAITDLGEDTVTCHQLGQVGSSDHHAILIKTEVGVAREEAVSRTIWLWDRADWSSLRKDLQRTDWSAILTGCADEKARAFTERLKSLQRQHVPHRQYTSRPTDQPWFGYRCRLAAERKYSAWLRFKRNPTLRNKTLHREACRSMTATSMWAQRRWENDLRSKLCGPGVGSKTWWSLIKERQGTSHQETIPPLTRLDGTTATSSKEKADLLADIFATKMTVADPNRPPPQLAQECDQEITMVEVTQGKVEHLLRAVDVRKASGPDDVSPQVLRHCSKWMGDGRDWMD